MNRSQRARLPSMWSQRSFTGPPCTRGGRRPRGVPRGPGAGGGGPPPWRSPPPPGGGGGGPPPGTPAPADPGAPAREALPQEGPDDRAPALDEDGPDAAGLEVVQEGPQVDVVLPAPEDLRVLERPIAVGRRHDEGGRGRVEDLRVGRGAAAGVEDDAQGVPTRRVLRLHGQLGIVLEDGPDPHEDRVDLRPKLVGAAGG